MGKPLFSICLYPAIPTTVAYSYRALPKYSRPARAARYTVEEDFLVYLLQKKSGLSENEANGIYKDWAGKLPFRQTSLGEKGLPAAKSGSPSSYRPSAPPTTRCPLCGREGADKMRILMYAKDPIRSQMTLEKFIIETIAR